MTTERRSSIEPVVGVRRSRPVSLVLLALVAVSLFLTTQPAFGSGFDGEIDVVLLGDSYSAGNGAGDY